MKSLFKWIKQAWTGFKNISVHVDFLVLNHIDKKIRKQMYKKSAESLAYYLLDRGIIKSDKAYRLDFNADQYRLQIDNVIEQLEKRY